MYEGAHNIQIGIAMRNHYPLGPRGCATSVVDGDEVTLVDSSRHELARSSRECRFIIMPPLFGPFQRHEMFDIWQLVTNSTYGIKIIAMGTDNPCTAMVDNIGKVVGSESIVNWHDNCSNLRHGVK